MRIKININQLKQTKPESPEIALREREIEMLNKKIEESNNTIENNTSIKNKYVNVAEASYNILLRKDNFPQYFYLEICNRLGVRINEREHFIRDFEGERYGIQNGVLKKEFITEDAKEAAMIHQKSNQSKQQKRYIPPCFRQEVQEVLTQENKEDQDINQDKDDSEQVESFPQLTNISVVNTKNSVWNNKPNIKSEIIPEKTEETNIKHTPQQHIALDKIISDDEDDWSKM